MVDARFKITATDATKQAFDSAQRNIDGVSKSIGAVGTAVAGLVSAGALGAMVRQVANAGDEIQKLSIRLNASTEALSQYKFVAERSGVSFDTLTTAWQKLNTRAAEAAAGQGEARDAFRELGIQVEAFSRLAPEQKFEALADAMQNVADAGRRQYLAQKLMEEGGVKLLQAMEGGSASIRELRAQADALGLTMTRVQADAFADFNDRLTDAKAGIQGAAQAIVVSLGPTIVEAARAFSVATSEVAKFIDGLRDIDNRTNMEGLREELAAVNAYAVDLAKQIEIVNKTGDASPLEAKYEAARAKASELIEKLRELDSASASAAGGGAVADFNVTAGAPLPSLADEKAAEAAEERARAEEERQREEFARRLEAVQDAAATELEVLQQTYLDRVFIIEEAIQGELIAQEEANEIKLALEQKYQDKRQAIERRGESALAKFRRKSQIEPAQDVFTHLNSMLQGVSTHNKALFAINKAAAIADAVINAHLGAAKTMGAYPYPINIALAALSYIAGAARVAAIAGTSFESAGGGGGAAGGGGAPIPVFNSDPVFGLPDNQQSEKMVAQDVTINLGDTDQLISTTAVRALIEQINEQAEDGAVIRSIKVA